MWAVLVAVVVACGSPQAPPSSSTTPRLPDGTPVVLISIDTLRADHLPAYGYRGVDTPHLDALRRDGILFEHAYSHIPLTLPAHTSILTGLLPPEHGVRDNIGYKLDAARVDSGEIPYLPRLLHERGYTTGAAVSTYVLRGKTGLDHDFDFYEDSIEFRTGVGLGGIQRTGDVTLNLSVEWLRSAARGPKPLFFFFHLYEPHTPYRPPEPFASRYPSAYDGKIAAADDVVGRLLDELRALGVYDRALIVFLSDHGEGLGDHGEDEHGVLLYATTLHVPLIVKLPGGEKGGTSASAPAEHVDLVPTVAELLGLPVPPRLRGASWLGLLGPDAPRRRIYSETFYPRLHFGWSELASLIDGEHHYIEGPDPELYDLAADPGETANVLRGNRRVLAEMHDELATVDRSLAGPELADEESRQALASLGYLTSVAAVEGPLPDPKSRLHTLVDLKEGFHFQSEKDYRKAADAFRRALAENPGMVDAWEQLGRALQSLGDREGALAAYQQGLKISGGSSNLAISVASLCFDLGRLDEAEAHAKLALDSHASFAHGLLARIALRRGRLDEAEHEARLALEERQTRIGPSIILAAVLHAQGRYEEAMEWVGRSKAAYAQRATPDLDLLEGLALTEGKIDADLGRTAEAEAAFRLEIERFPDALAAYTNLALLYGLTGRPQDVSAVLREMTEARPSPEAYVEAVKTLRVLGWDPGAAALLQHARQLFPQDSALRDLASG